MRDDEPEHRFERDHPFVILTVKTLIALLLLLALPLFGAPARDWTQCPAVASLDTTEVVYALGDTHGDYKRLVALLKGAKLIPQTLPATPAELTWSGGKSVLVVTGDMIDKWENSLDVIAAFRALAASAPAQGGRVIISAGNHEAEFLSKPVGGKTQEFQDELTAAGIAPQSVADGTDKGGIGKFLLCLPLASRVNGWFFSHAGSTGGKTLPELATAIENGVKADGYNTAVLLGADEGLLEARMKPPWWQKSGDTPDQSRDRLHSYAKALGVQHIVFGHQPGKYEFIDGAVRKKGVLFQHYDGLFFMIDRGMSAGVDYSQGGLLRIVQANGGEVATEVLPDGSEKPLWQSKP